MVYYIKLRYTPKQIADEIGVPELEIEKIIKDMKISLVDVNKIIDSIKQEQKVNVE